MISLLNIAGLLKCSTFSYVTLEGKEISRFIVPGMQGGLFVYCGNDGSILISDVVKKSVFVLRDGHVHLEIANNQYLKVISYAIILDISVQLKYRTTKSLCSEEASNTCMEECVT